MKIRSIGRRLSCLTMASIRSGTTSLATLVTELWIVAFRWDALYGDILGIIGVR